MRNAESWFNLSFLFVLSRKLIMQKAVKQIFMNTRNNRLLGKIFRTEWMFISQTNLSIVRKSISCSNSKWAIVRVVFYQLKPYILWHKSNLKAHHLRTRKIHYLYGTHDLLFLTLPTFYYMSNDIYIWSPRRPNLQVETCYLFT